MKAQAFVTDSRVLAMERNLRFFAGFVCCLFISVLQVSGQTGPGGVEEANGLSNLRLWLRADDISGTNGDPISTWPDASGNSFDATQTGTSRPTFLTNTINGLPVVRLDGIDDYFDDNHSYSANYVFAVYNFRSTLQGTDDLGQLWGAYGNGVHIAFDTRAGNQDGLSFDGNTSVGNQGRYGFNGATFGSFISNDNTNPVTLDQFDIVTAEFNANRALTRQVIGGLHPNFTISQHNFGGDIAEIIVYDRVLNNAERIAVENYLSSKYNVSIGSNDFYTLESTHNSDVAGVGRIDASNIKSAANSSGILQVSGLTDLEDGEYLFFAHDDANSTWTTSEIPSEVTDIQRIAREWRLDETSTDGLGTVKFTIDGTQLDALPAGYTKYVLLSDVDGDFTSGASIHEMLDIGGNEFEADISITDGQYISVGIVRPVIGFLSTTQNDFESLDGTISIALNYIIHPAQPDVTVDYETRDVASEAQGATTPFADADNEDYEIIATTQVTITAGNQSTSFGLNINQDTQLEDDEELEILLTNNSEANLDNDILTYTINDDDNPRKIFFDQATSSVDEITSSIDIQINITPAFVDAVNPTTVDYAVTGGSAIDPDDFTLASGTLTINPNFIANTFSVTISDDALKEDDETIVITLSNPTNSALSGTDPIVHTLTILDDEPDPSVQFNLASSSGAEDSSPSINVVLSAIAGSDVLVDYVVSGSATGGGDDFTLANGTLTIPAGDLSANINLPVNDDTTPESTETVIIDLSGTPTNAVLGTSTTHTYSIVDNDGDFGFTGPGGVGSSTVNQLWLKADEITGLTDGVDLTVPWTDASGNSNNAAQTSAALPGGSSLPTYETNEINGRSVVRFDHTVLDILIDDHSYAGRTMFSVFRATSAFDGANNDLGQIWGNYEDQVHVALDARTGNERGFSFDGDGPSSTSARYGLDGAAYSSLLQNTNVQPWVADQAHIISTEFDQSRTVTRQVIGSLEPDLSGFNLGADIGEIIVYNVTLNSARRNLVENYLAAKWGITVTNDLYAFEGSHSYDLAGIGAESDGDHTDALSDDGILRVNNASSLDAGDYLIFGNDNGDITSWTNAEIPTGADSIQRIAREWVIDETNEVGTFGITLTDPTTTLGAVPTDYVGYVLLIDDDGDFSNGGTTVTELTQNGSDYVAAGIDLSADSYITFGVVAVTVEFTAISSSVSEGGTSIDLEVSLSRTSSVDVDVTFSVNGASTAAQGGGNDYTFGTVSPLTITAGNPTGVITININDDGATEVVETVVIDLNSAASANGADLGSNRLTHTLTILDNDALAGSTGPGGVMTAASYEAWLRADADVFSDAGTTPANDGDLILQWNDQTGNAHHASSFTGVTEPTYTTPDAGLNSKSSSNHSLTDAALTITNENGLNTGSNFAEKTLLVAFQTGSDVNNRQVVYEQGGGGNGLNVYVESNMIHIAAWDNDWATGLGNTNGYVDFTGAALASTDYVAFLQFDGATQTFNVHLNTVDLGTSIAVGQPDLDSHGGDVGIGGMINDSRFSDTDSDAGQGNYFTGRIAEILTVNSLLNEAERIIIENYLAGKYDIDISVGNDFYAHKTTHSFDIVGIGQSSGEFHVGATSANLVSISNPSSLDDNDFMIIGHDNGDINSYVTTETPDADTERLAREWRVDKTNEIGSVVVTYDPAGTAATPGADFNHYAVLVDSDGDGDFTTGTPQYITMSPNGGVFEATVNFSDGDYFTIAAFRPRVQFTLTVGNGLESSSPVNIEISLNHELNSDATVDYTLDIGNSTATEGVGNDFTLTNGTATITAGNTTTDISINLLTDGLIEPDETVEIDLSSPSAGLFLGTNDTFIYSINDIDDSREIDFSVPTSQANEGATVFNFTIRLNQANGSQITSVDYAVIGGSASGSGTDFTLASGTANVAINDLQTTFLVSINDDLLDENDETLVIELTNPVNARLGTNTQHTFTILDNDTAPTIEFVTASTNGSEANSPANIAVQLSAISGLDVSVDFQVTGGTATGGGTDYFLADGTLTITAGNSLGSIPISIINDTDLEVDETIDIGLIAPVSNATIGASSNHTFTINDNDAGGFTGPGGVRSPIDYVAWLRSDREVFNDAGVTSASDGEEIVQWNDQSGNGNHGVGVQGATAPIYSDNSTDNVNFKPVINFDVGSGTFIEIPDNVDINSGGPYPERTFALAFQAGNDVSTQQVVFEEGGGTNGLAVYIENNEVLVAMWNETIPAETIQTLSSPITAGQNVLVIFEFDQPDMTAWVNGVNLGTYTGFSDLQSHGGNISFGLSSDGWDLGGTDEFDGKVMEFFTFNGTFNDTERILIENYLGAKYIANLTASGNDFYNHEGVQSYGIAGIGRVSSTDFHVKAQSDQMIAVSNASQMDDGEYFIFGHDNGSIAGYTTTESVDANVERLAREWRVTKTGDVGTVKLEFDPTNVGSGPSAGYSEFVLLVDTDGNFSSGTTIVPLTLNGSVYEVDGASFNDGDYFTIGVIQPVIQFTVDTDNGPEDTSPVPVEISLNHPLAQDVTVTVTENGTGSAVEGSDFNFTDGTATISSGNTNTTTDITIINDSEVESDETVVLALSAPSLGSLGANATHTYTINDDDNFRKANFALSSDMGDEGTSPILVEVTLNVADAINPSDVFYVVSGGTATGSGTDYTLANGTVTFAPGSTSENISISINDDALDEEDETIIISLTGGTNTTLGTTTEFTYTIQDNDLPPAVQFTNTARSGAESFQTVDLAVELSAASGKDITLSFTAPGAGTATGGGTDFSIPTNTLVIPAGAVSDSIRYTVIDDAIEELNETIEFTLTDPPTNATLGTNQVLTYTILDNDGLGADGPGGVGNLNSQISMWLRSTNAPGLTNGDDIGTWEDQTNNNNDAFQVTTGMQPTYLTGIWNNRAAVEFDGDDVLDIADTDDINTGGPYDKKTILVAFRTSTDITSRQMIYEEGGGVRGLSIYIDNGDLYIGGWNNNDDDLGATTPWPQPGPPTNYTSFVTRPVTANSNNFLVLQFDFDIAGMAFNGDVRGSLNGEPLIEITGAGRLFAHPGDIAVGGVRNGTVFHDQSTGGEGFFFDGNVAEVIVNNVVYNDAQRRIVNNYFGSKFNVNIGAEDIYDHQLNHSYQVFGIGQIDISNTHNESKGPGVVRILNPSNLDDDEFMLIGHDNGSVASWSSTEVPGNDTGNFTRLAREWRADESGGDVGTISLELLESDFASPPVGFTDNYVIMIDDDGDFTSGAQVIQMTDAGGGTFTVDNVDLSGDQYFTFALANPVVQFTSSVANGDESASPVNTEVTLNYMSSSDVTVDYNVTGGDATEGAGNDFVLADGTVTISAGSQTSDITITVNDDGTNESDETIEITLSNPSGASLGANTIHTYTINDNDAPRSIQFSTTTASAAENAGTGITIQVELDVVDGTAVTTATYTVTGGSATEGVGNDYVLANGIVTVPINQATADITLDILEDVLDEDDEDFEVTLSSPSANANLGTNTVFTFTITDNDAEPSVQFTAAASDGIEAVTSTSIQVDLSVVSGKDVTVNYSVNVGTTAVNGGIDFDLQTSSLVIPAGSLSGTIDFSIFDDAIIEGDETVILDIDNAVNATVSGTLQHTYTIEDDDGSLGPIGPGGVGESPGSPFWLRSDAGVFNDTGTTLASDGDLVVFWNDQSGGTRNATDTSAVTNSPIYRDNVVDNINNRPVLEFNGVDDMMTIANDAFINTETTDYSQKAIMVAFQAGADVATRQVVYEQGGGGNGMNIYVESNALHFGAWSTTNGWNYFEITNPIAINDVVFAIFEFDQTVGDGELRAWVNGTQLTTNTGPDAALNSHGGLVGIGGMNNDTRYGTGTTGTGEGDYFQGNIMELMHLNERVTNSAQRKLIGSYMAGKYGINMGTDDLYDHDGTRSYEIFGIGQDDASNRHTEAQGPGLIRFDSPLSLDDGDYIIAGHDNGSIGAFDGTNSPNSSFVEIVDRTWQIDKNGTDIGGIRMAVDVSQLPTPNAGFQEYFLLVDDDNDGVFNDAPIGSFNFVRLGESFGTYQRASGIDLADGTVFTIAMAVNVAVQNGMWNDPATWLLGVPTATEPVTIGSGVTVTLDSDISALSVTVDGGTLDLNGFELELAETLDFLSGTFNANSGTIEYAAPSGSFCIEGLTYHNLIISGGGTKTLCGNVIVEGNIEITNNPTLDTDVANNYSITVRGNWSSAVDAGFNTNTSTITFDHGSNAQSITKTSGTETFYNLVINKTANDVTIATGSVAIANQLNLTNGDIVLGSNNLLIQTTSNTAITGGSTNSYIQADGTGTVCWDIALTTLYDFPVGDVDDFSPVEFHLNSGTVASPQICVRVTDAIHPNLTPIGDYITRYWTVTQSGITNPDFNINATYTDGDIVGSESGLQPVKYNPFVIADAADFSIDIANNIMSWNNIPSFSDFTAGGEVSLPVELLFFTGEMVEDGILLEWTTAQEINNDYFDVQHSTDAFEFATIHTVEGSGNTSERVDYTHLDRNVHSGIHYYRLRQVDFDGSSEVSKVISVEVPVKSEREFRATIYPNPAEQHDINLRLLSSDRTAPVQIFVHDLTGRQIHQQLVDAEWIGLDIEVQPSVALSRGTYLMTIRQMNQEKVLRLFVR